MPRNVDKVTSMPLSDDMWVGYGPNNDGRMERLDVDAIETEDPEEAARRFCAETWASGTHRVLVVNLSQAFEYEIVIESIEMVVERG